MGTSQSSSGAPSNVPLVPPWVPDPPAANDGTNTDEEGQGDATHDSAAQPVVHRPHASTARFGSARSRLGSFGRTGSSADMRIGLRHYTSRGLGGSAAATRRLENTAQTARALYSTLAPPGAAVQSSLDRVLLAGSSAQHVLATVVEVVRPIDGTLDSESSRHAIHKALSELLQRFPGADLLNLSEEERVFAVERYVALEVYSRFRLDVGEAVKNKAPSTPAALDRLRQARDYITQTVAASFRGLRENGRALSSSRVSAVVRSALQKTFTVFEEYV